MNILLGVIIGFLILMALVVAHEFGHFIAARKNGVEVEEFGIGFPPRAKAWVKNPEWVKWKEAKKSGKLHPQNSKKPQKWLSLAKSDWDKKQKTLVFSINWLPIGGFCSMKGESDSDTAPRSFGSASLWAKTKILFAGVAMNWLAAFLILTVLAWTGMPVFMDNQFRIESDSVAKPATVTIKEIEPGSPAEAAGLKIDDQIISANDHTFLSYSDIISFNQQNAGKTIKYLVIRDGDQKEVEVKLNDADADYQLGIVMSQFGQELYRSTWSAPVTAAVNTVQLTGETFRGLGYMLGSLGSGIIKQFSSNETTRAEGQSEIKQAGDSVSGPVGIIGVLFPNSVSQGPTTLGFLAALISVSLACMNVLPIPALDGGRFFLIALFRLRGKKLEKSTEEKIVSRAFVFLLILIVIVTILDITRFF